MRVSLHLASLGLLLGLVVPGLGAQGNPAAKPAAKPAAPAAQSSADAERAMDSIRTAVKANRKKIIAAGMDLTTEEHQKFWPLYAEYRDSAAIQGDRLMKIIMEYAKNYSTLTDAQATKLMADYAGLDQDRINLRAAYIKKFGAFLPPRKLMRYFQMENKLDAIVNYDLAATIPLPKE